VKDNSPKILIGIRYLTSMCIIANGIDSVKSIAGINSRSSAPLVLTDLKTEKYKRAKIEIRNTIP
jgi:hypothetical protein